MSSRNVGSENPAIEGNITTSAPKIYAKNINDTVVVAWLCYKRLRHYADTHSVGKVHVLNVLSSDLLILKHVFPCKKLLYIITNVCQKGDNRIIIILFFKKRLSIL